MYLRTRTGDVDRRRDTRRRIRPPIRNPLLLRVGCQDGRETPGNNAGGTDTEMIDIPIGRTPTGKRSFTMAYKFEVLRLWDQCLDRGSQGPTDAGEQSRLEYRPRVGSGP